MEPKNSRTMSKVVCVECEDEMKVVKTGVVISELGGDGKPYKVWHADKFKCALCGKEVISNFADRPIMQRGVTNDDVLRETAVIEAVVRF